MLRRQRRFVWSDGWYIHFKDDDYFNIISFDIINVIFKCYFSSEFCCFNSSHTNLLELIVKGCGNFRKMLLLYNKLWWNIHWCFIEHFSTLWEAQCFCVERDQLFFDMFWFLMLSYLGIYIISSCSSKLCSVSDSNSLIIFFFTLFFDFGKEIFLFSLSFIKFH